jgi:hypothetical protein
MEYISRIYSVLNFTMNVNILSTSHSRSELVELVEHFWRTFHIK